ncbi:MAG: nucleotidyltransferase domain-containing protein [Minisyncoccales bacterium]
MAKVSNKKDNQIEIKRITRQIVEKYKPEKIILFGSFAWGKPTKDSDVDLFIIKKSKKKRLEREYELRMKLLGNKFPPMDLLIYTPKEVARRFEIGDFFIRDIFKTGKILYETK